MTRNKVMQLWTAFVTAFLALCAALGLLATTAAAATPRPEPAHETHHRSSAHVTEPTLFPWSWSYARSLPPTMKQRIRAEAHGKSPSCRHRPFTDTEADAPALPGGAYCAPVTPPEHTAPLQR